MRRLLGSALLAACPLGCGGGPAGDVVGTPDPPGSTPGRYFPDGEWYRDVSTAPLDAESRTVIAFLAREGFGTGEIRVDFSLEVLEAGSDAPLRSFVPTDDFFSPDCDLAPVPVPAGGALEGERGYACESDGDCHLIVAHRPARRLYEMWRADIRGEEFRGGCLAVWDMARVYGPAGRGEQCTSADAAGYPIAPLLFSADEVAAGQIAHAVRFILPNSRIRRGEYVHPATHGTPAASGPRQAPPYGARLRLRAGYDVDALPSAGARVVASALQRYGMFLADGGQITLTAQSDRFTRARWDGLLGPRDLSAIRPGDFEMIEAGARIPLTLDCVREP
jgi:serine/threonine-protein kinase